MTAVTKYRCILKYLRIFLEVDILFMKTVTSDYLAKRIYRGRHKYPSRNIKHAS